MNILLWVLQILLAFHTIMGAVWKFSNPSQSIPSLEAIPPSGWMVLSVIELLCGLALILPLLKRSLGSLASYAALFIAAEMLLYCVLHLFSGEPGYNPMIYWVVVAAISAFLAYGRLVLAPRDASINENVN